MPDRAETLRKLDVIRVVAAVDFVLLVVLVGFAIGGAKSGVQVLGPIHGVIFLGLLYLTVVGAGEKRWSPWLCLATIIPVAALVLEERLRRELRAAGRPTGEPLAAPE